MLIKYKIGYGVWIVAILLVCACSCLACSCSRIKFVLLGHGDVVWKIVGEKGAWEFGAKLEKSNSF